MMSRITDPDVQMLATIAGTLKSDYIKDLKSDPWAESPFNWIRQCPSRQRGKIGEQLLAGWCAAKGLDVTRSPDSEADRLIEGRRVEVKFSTRWETGIYKFQQIRDQKYEHLICLGICPFDAHCWVIPKNELRHAQAGLTGQHMGRAGKDTAWLSFSPDSPPQWLNRFGGSLGKAFPVLMGLRS